MTTERMTDERIHALRPKTPGPWSVYQEVPGAPCRIHGPTEHGRGSIGSALVRDDAQVMAAAPELLAEIERLRRVEQEQAEKIRALEGKLALVMGERDAAETKAAHLERRLAVAHETITTTNDKMTERERLARHDVASEVLEDVERFKDLDDVLEFLHKVRIANAPKD